MTTELWLANIAFGAALSLFGVLIKVLFGRIATNERSANERFSQLDSRVSATEAMHVGSRANHDALKELFEAKFQPLKRDIDNAIVDVRGFSRLLDDTRRLLDGTRAEVAEVFSMLEALKILLQTKTRAG